MTLAPARPGSPIAGAAPPAPIGRTYRFELTKLLSQWRVRGLLGVSAVAPAFFVAAVSQQSTLPTDTVFGRWMLATGASGSLVVLGFACAWVLPLLTSLVAGDAFAAEDRLGTWRHLLVTVRSPRRIFLAKSLAGLTVIVLLVAALALSSMVGGLLAVGAHPLVGLDGRLMGTGEAFATTALAWCYVLAPTLAFAGVGLLGSIALGRSPMGLLVPAALAFVLQLAQMLPLPVAVRMALPSHGFLAWRALFSEPVLAGPLLAGLAVDLAWTVATLALAYWTFLRRDFTDLAHEGGGRRLLVSGAVPLAALVAVTAVVFALTTSASGSGVEKPKLEAAMAEDFAQLYVLQTDQLNRPAVTVEQLNPHARCTKGSKRVPDSGPGNDWRCIVGWSLPDAGDARGRAIYQVDVTPDGRFIADGDGPKEVNGYFQVRTPTGDAPNPLWQLDGTVDLLSASPKE